jgi:hypothetical protein
MSMVHKDSFPPNPYKLKPIKQLKDLAGRKEEIKTISYYLNLTTTGDSPHLALIGQRGVGKTSLLNSIEDIAKDLKLLSVRLDLNEQKANSIGRFWHDLYLSLALSMVKVGCWGGEHGVIYQEILSMLYSRKPGSLDKAVMQLPFAFSCNQESIDSFICSDALVVHDFSVCLQELKTKNLSGIVFLIDEADCIGKNIPLLQMFRNIFQNVESCSLVLAGTEAVFPVLSDVFSPIPRQFHRIKVNPFSAWYSTLDLVLRPISENIQNTICPKLDVLQALHDLCSGAPDEIQLYCHHMYRNIENGKSDRMNLSPEVFREVLNAYRSNTSSSDVILVLNEIERLPSKLLFESKWLSRRNITLNENIKVSSLMQELQNDSVMSAEEELSIKNNITAGYKTLFDQGIIKVNNKIDLVGAPLSAGFWKSYVEVKKRVRWAWNDKSFVENMRNTILITIGKLCGGGPYFEVHNGVKIRKIITSLRANEPLKDADDCIGEIINSALSARKIGATHVVDIDFQWDFSNEIHVTQVRFVEKPDTEICKDYVVKWIESHSKILIKNEISLDVNAFERWELPTIEELHRLGYILKYPIPSVFGITPSTQAVLKFGEGDVEEALRILARLLSDRDDPGIRNNYAFCQIYSGDYLSGLENLKRVIELEYKPLYQLNMAVAHFLLDETEKSKQDLQNALTELQNDQGKFTKDADYLLVLSADLKSASKIESCPVEVAIIINLWRMGELTYDELVKRIERLMPGKSANLLELLH